MNCLIFLVGIVALSSEAASNTDNSGRKQLRYKIRHELVDWREAELGCFYHFGITYAHIENNQDVNDLIKEIPFDPIKKYWIAGYYEEKPECDDEPFLDTCWKWDDFNVQPYFNSSLIKFSEAAQAVTPTQSSAMLLSFVDSSPGLEHDDKSSLYSTICDYEFREPVQPPRTRKTTTTPIPLKLNE